VLLGDRVGVVQLAAQRRLEVALDLRVRAVGEDVVGAGHVPGQRVGDAPELLLDEEPLDVAPALAAVLDGVQPAAQAAGQRLVADLLDALGRQPPAGALGLLLERHQDLLDERARSGLQLGLLGGQRLITH
jgi:hypothetical protein